MRKKRAGESGFTLIELLIVIVILGILAAVVVFAVGGITDRGEEAACKSDLKTVEVAEEASYAQDGVYRSLADLKTAKFIRSVPDSDSYDIQVVVATGEVTSDPA